MFWTIAAWTIALAWSIPLIYMLFYLVSSFVPRRKRLDRFIVNLSLDTAAFNASVNDAARATSILAAYWGIDLSEEGAA